MSSLDCSNSLAIVFVDSQSQVYSYGCQCGLCLCCQNLPQSVVSSSVPEIITCFIIQMVHCKTAFKKIAPYTVEKAPTDVCSLYGSHWHRGHGRGLYCFYLYWWKSRTSILFHLQGARCQNIHLWSQLGQTVSCCWSQAFTASQQYWIIC